MKTFSCNKCGACCQQLKLFGPLYADLDSGNGVCKYYQAKTHECSIYEKRPLICRVEEGYTLYFSHVPHDEYIEKTMEACKKLQENLKHNPIES